MKKTTPTWYRSLKGWKYELLEERHVGLLSFGDGVRAGNEFITLFRDYEGGHRYHVLTVHPHYHWDGPSGPTFDRSQNMRASLFHDALCQLIGEGLLDKKYRKYADQLFRQHLLEDGMGKFWAWGYYLAVRGWSKFKGM